MNWTHDIGSEGLSERTMARQELEESWRQRLEEKLRRYHTASEEYRRLLREEADGQCPLPDSPLACARRAESEALMEYSRVLRIFSDLTVHGKVPDESTLTASDAAWSRGGCVISVVDDDESVRDSTRKLLRSAGYRVSTFESAEIFLESGAISDTECMVLDLRMPGMDGLELQRRLNLARAGIPIIFLTAHDDARSRRAAMDGGAVDFLCKPFEANSLVSAVETALTRHDVNRQSH